MTLSWNWWSICPTIQLNHVTTLRQRENNCAFYVYVGVENCVCIHQWNKHRIKLEWVHKQFATTVYTSFHFLHGKPITEDQRDDFLTSALYPIWSVYVLMMMSQLIIQHIMWLGNCDVSRWEVISNLLDIDFKYAISFHKLFVHWWAVKRNVFD